MKDLLTNWIDENFPHSPECIKANKELGDKFDMEFGEKCMCIDRNKIKSLLDLIEGEVLKVVDREGQIYVKRVWLQKKWIFQSLHTAITSLFRDKSK